MDTVKYWNTDDISKVLGVTRQTIFNLRKSGILPYIQLGRRILFKPADVEKALDEKCRVEVRRTQGLV